MSDLTDLYQEVILDHSKRPRNSGGLEAPTHRAEGHNPLCGDELEVQLCIDADERMTEIAFTGRGCAISTASASLMTEALKGRTTAEAQELFEHFHAAVTAAHDATIDPAPLGKLAALTGVREFPMRVKCASLAWHTLQAAVHGDGEPVTTE